MKIIARIRSDFPTKFGIPRQSGRVEELTACTGSGKRTGRFFAYLAAVGVFTVDP